MSQTPDISSREFIALMALLTSLAAMSIDAMLPALGQMSADLNAKSDNSRHLIISVLLLGMGIGQVFFGPLSDALGRKRPVYLGLSLFIIGTLLSMFASSMLVMLSGRLLQGIGSAAPRVVCMALVRDKYEGEAMARTMSLITAIFILVPVFAPSLGQAILLFASWRAIFGMFLMLALIVLAWFFIRQTETLTPQNRRSFSFRELAKGIGEVIRNRAATCHALASGLVFAGLLVYLNLSQQIFQEHYGLGNKFPLFFGALASTMSVASLLNAKLVMRLGIRKLLYFSCISKLIVSMCVLLLVFLWKGFPPLAVMYVYMMTMFLLLGFSFGNFTAMAMKPLGHIAGVGAAVVGSISTLTSVSLSLLVSQTYVLTVYPIVVGYIAFASLALILFRLSD